MEVAPAKNQEIERYGNLVVIKTRNEKGRYDKESFLDRDRQLTPVTTTGWILAIPIQLNSDVEAVRLAWQEVRSQEINQSQSARVSG